MLEEKLGLKKNTMTEILQNMNNKVLSKKDEVGERLLVEHPDGVMFKKISDLIKDRSQILRMQKAIKQV